VEDVRSAEYRERLEDIIGAAREGLRPG
jgi:hypothetical protein